MSQKLALLNTDMKANKKGDIEIQQIIVILMAVFALLILLYLTVKWGKQSFIALLDFVKKVFS